MAPGAKRLYNQIHRQQLFNWIGNHIEKKGVPDRVLTDGERHEYVDCLRGTLNKGLWLQRSAGDEITDGSVAPLTLPMLCFTEWQLDESWPHAAKYGRMAFGFPKRFVLQHGGQPVAYFRDHRKLDPYRDALRELKTFFDQKNPDGALQRKMATLQRHFEYLLHFNKPIKRAASKKPKSLVAEVEPMEGPDVPILEPLVVRNQRKRDPLERNWGTTLHFLEEREWRIVAAQKLLHFFDEGPGDGQPPDYFLPFEIGTDLYTVVLPDSGTVSLAMNDQQIRTKLFPPGGAHVTVLSIKDVPTF